MRRRAPFGTSCGDRVHIAGAVVIGMTAIRVYDEGASADAAAEKAPNQILVVAF